MKIRLESLELLQILDIMAHTITTPIITRIPTVAITSTTTIIIHIFLMKGAGNALNEANGTNR